ncbi:MAG TPA: ornithine carbamoyltransferase [Candidatus Omnitrophota bacterium]|nr:ornithine carbamoyltransferase [Candidatus Omnitrophota bacterium]HPD85342.1 ornithine carbamoyltransferase [Candidatus Omnitrophota bacterium]HRZ04157.1 ornithine carbamoyltransferase [Candidatus Omnitrophota bacterium]
MTQKTKRDFINVQNLTKEEIQYLFDLTVKLKKNRDQYAQVLKGKSVALIFQKPSNRTRVSFEVGIWQLGGNCIYLGPEEINLGKRESAADVAKTLSRYVDAIVARTFTHQDVIDLAKEASVPVINGLSDLSHPCQALADLFTINEKLNEAKGVTLAYVGDGNNVCNSLIFGCAISGVNIKIATPKGYEPNTAFIKSAQRFSDMSGAAITVTNKPQEAVENADVIYADTWVSMGQEAESKKRFKDFKGFQIDSKLASRAKKNYFFMHCLPAHREQEVTADIIDGPHSIIFDQAENRMHIQKAILVFLLGDMK